MTQVEKRKCPKWSEVDQYSKLLWQVPLALPSLSSHPWFLLFLPLSLPHGEEHILKPGQDSRLQLSLEERALNRSCGFRQRNLWLWRGRRVSVLIPLLPSDFCWYFPLARPNQKPGDLGALWYSPLRALWTEVEPASEEASTDLLALDYM